MAGFEALIPQISDFVYTYFINPIFTGEGYNIYNTVAYAFFLILGLYFVKGLMTKLGIKFDKEFFWALVPFVFFGGALRALSDLYAHLGYAKTFLLITPGIYFVIFFLALGTLLITKKLTKNYKKATMEAGILYALAALGLVLYRGYTSASNWEWLGIIVGGAIALTVLVYFVLKLMDRHTKENTLIGFGQMLDATATSISIAYLGYFEQHVVSSAVINLGSPFFFVPLKFAVAIGAIWTIEKYAESKQWEWLLKFVVLVLGAGPGTRDLLRAFMGV